jgi:hypothetical protein
MLTIVEQKSNKHILVHLAIEEIADEFRLSLFTSCKHIEAKLIESKFIKERSFPTFQQAFQSLLNAKKELESKKHRLPIDNKIESLPVLVVVE